MQGTAGRAQVPLAAKLPRSVRRFLGLHTQMLEPGVRWYLKSLAEKLKTGNYVDAPPNAASLAALIAVTGEKLRKVALLYDVQLPRVHDGHELHEKFCKVREQRQKLLFAARTLRGEYNRLRYKNEGKIHQHNMIHMLQKYEETVTQDCKTLPHVKKITSSLRAHLEFCKTRSPQVVALEAHNIVADILVHAKSICVQPCFSRSALQEEQVREKLRPMLANLSYALKHQLHYSAEAGEEVFMGGREALAEVKKRLLDHTRTGMHAFYEAGDRRSTPADILKSARRSYWAHHLAHALQLQCASKEYAQESDKENLHALCEVLQNWQSSDTASPYTSGAKGNLRRLFSRNPYAIRARSEYGYIRDMLLPHLEWALKNYEMLSQEIQHNLRLSVQNASHIVLSSLARGIWETPQAAFITDKTDIQRASSSYRELIKRGWDILHELAPLPVDPIALVAGSRKQSISELHRASCQQSTNSYEGGKFLFQAFAAWLGETKTRVLRAQGKSIQSTQAAMTVLEYEFFDDSRIDTERIFHRIEQMQEQRQVHAESEASGIVHVETAKALHALAKAHHGALFCLRESGLTESFEIQQIHDALFVTCSQKNPDPLLEELKTLSADYLNTLPQLEGSGLPHPYVLANLVISMTNSKQLMEAHGERPYEMLDEQFVFHLISTFPSAMFIDCFGICRKNNVALRAHRRFGWTKTGKTYTDEHGVEYEILHRRITPALRLLGFPVKE